MALSFAFRQQRRLVASTTSFSSPWGFSSMRSALDGLVTLPVSRIVRQELQHHPLFQVRFKSMLKTNKSAAKRFRIRGNGSIKRNKSGKSHNTGFKSRKRCKNLSESTSINGKEHEKRMRRLLGIY